MQTEQGATWAEAEGRGDTASDLSRSQMLTGIGARAEQWARYFARLANEERPLRGITESPVGELKASGLRGRALRDAVRKQNDRGRSELPSVDGWISEWRALRGDVDEMLPDAAVLAVIERHRNYLRTHMSGLVGRTGAELDELLTMPEATATVSTAISVPAYIQEVRGVQVQPAALYWEALVTMHEELRVPGSAARPETNVLFVALSLPGRILFQQCARQGCSRVFFVENKSARCCSPACRRVRWLSKPKTKASVREQTRLRVQRYRATKRRLKGDGE